MFTVKSRSHPATPNTPTRPGARRDGIARCARTRSTPGQALRYVALCLPALRCAHRPDLRTPRSEPRAREHDLPRYVRRA